MRRLVVVFAFSLAGCSASNEEAATAAVSDLLKDPFSAQFRGIECSDFGCCGEVNAKNLYGAYTGWRTFSASKADDGWSAIIADDSGSLPSNLALIACGKEPVRPQPDR